jgi:TRAP-type C4-dicarboxylate transport system permease small subunit
MSIVRERMEALYSKATRSIMWLTYAAICFMTLMIVVDVIGRFVFNRPLPATVDMSELVLPWIIFIPLAYTLTIRGHVRVTLLTSRMSLRSQKCSEAFACILGFALFVVLAIRGWSFFWDSFVIRERMLAPIYLPMFIGKLAMPIGSVLIALQFLLQIVNVTTGKYR